MSAHEADAATRISNRVQTELPLLNEREIARLTEAIATSTEPVPSLMERLKPAQQRRRELLAHVDGLKRASMTRPDWRDLERRIRRNLTDCRARFDGGIGEARQAFRELLTTPIVFTPCVVRGYRGIRFTGRIGLEAVFAGTLVTKLASPGGYGRLWTGEVNRRILLAA